MTVALKPETYKELAELKSRYKFRSFDDVVKLLLSCERP
jgi:predicted CopG family antitoxin